VLHKFWILHTTTLWVNQIYDSLIMIWCSYCADQYQKVLNMNSNLSAILSMKQGSLFVLFCFVCTYEIHQTGMLQIVFLVSLESSWWGGVHQLGSMTFGLAVQKFLKMISSLKIKLNRSWKFRRNWNVPLVLLERSWSAGFIEFIW
jgi:hypothetical protein